MNIIRKTYYMTKGMKCKKYILPLVFCIFLEIKVLYIFRYWCHDPQPTQSFHLPNENELQDDGFRWAQRNLNKCRKVKVIACLFNPRQHKLSANKCQVSVLKQVSVPSLDAFVSTHFPKKRKTFGSPGLNWRAVAGRL